jgi:hypothetical protein
MGGFKDLSFVERRNAAADAKRAALGKFREHAAAPVTSERQKARTAAAADRAEANRLREIEKAEGKARDAQLAIEAERDAAVQVERALTEKANREAALQTERKTARDARYAARKARSKAGRHRQKILSFRADLLKSDLAEGATANIAQVQME